MYYYLEFANEENQSFERQTSQVIYLAVKEQGCNPNLCDFRPPALLGTIFPSKRLPSKRVQFPFVCMSGVRDRAVPTQWPKSRFTFPDILLGKIRVCLSDSCLTVSVFSVWMGSLSGVPF